MSRGKMKLSSVTFFESILPARLARLLGAGSAAGSAATDAGLARKRMFSFAKTYASEHPARQAPIIHGIQLGSGHSSVRPGGFAFIGEAEVPSL